MSRRSSILVLGWLGVVTSGCGTDVAQTAEYRPRVTVDCSAPTTAATLPSSGPLSATDRVIDSLLISTTYAAGSGPGILVASRDAFRLYVNGELLLESTDSLTPRFVGYSFLPGKNVVSIVAVGAARPPLVLVRVDELEQTHVSDAGWKVSTTPSAGWMTPVFDDSSWPPASEFGVVDAQAGCASSGTAFAGSSVRFIGAADPSVTAAAFRYRFDIVPTGFGAATTGGGDAAITVANSVSQLRAAVETDDTQRVIVVPEGVLDLRPAGTEVVTQLTCPESCTTSTVMQYVVLPTGTECNATQASYKRNDRQLRVRSNKTIVGLGRGAHLRGAWFDLTSSSNLIFRNLAWYDVNPGLIEAGDGLSLSATSRVWVDHCSFKWISDGFTDLNATSTQVTFSWDSFDGENAAECLGRHLRSNELVDSEATYHHSLWRRVDGRAPFVHGTTARAHLYNNVVIDAVDYAVGSGCTAQVLLEGSYFESVAAPTSIRDCVETPGAYGSISAPAGSNLYGTGTGAHQSKGSVGQEPHDSVFAPPYSYRVEPAAEIRFKVQERSGAGSRWALPIARD